MNWFQYISTNDCMEISFCQMDVRCVCVKREREKESKQQVRDGPRKSITHKQKKVLVLCSTCFFFFFLLSTFFINIIYQKKKKNEKLTHEIKHHVNVTIIFCFQDITETNNVWVSCQLLQVLNFTVCSLCICGITKGVKTFFDGKSLSCLFINALPHNSVSTLAQFLKREREKERQRERKRDDECKVDSKE